MTSAQHKARIRRMVKTWRTRLMLDHVTIEIEWDEEPEDPEALASVYCSDMYDHATMRFRSDLTDYDTLEMNRIVVHELMHVMFRDYGQAVRAIDAVGALSSDVRYMWHTRCRDAEEGLVDRLANRFVELGGAVE